MEPKLYEPSNVTKLWQHVEYAEHAKFYAVESGQHVEYVKYVELHDGGQYVIELNAVEHEHVDDVEYVEPYVPAESNGYAADAIEYEPVL